MFTSMIIFAVTISFSVNLCISTPVHNHSTITLRRRSMANRYGVVIALAVKAAWEETPDDDMDCFQLFGGYTYKSARVGYEMTVDILENITFSPEMSLKNIQISGLNPFDLNCFPLKFKHLPADLITIFPGGPNQNCRNGTGFCDVLIAKHENSSRDSSTSTEDEGSLPFCVTLFTAQVKIPSLEVLQKDAHFIIENVHPISHTCEPDAFFDLLQGNTNVEDHEALPNQVAAFFSSSFVWLLLLTVELLVFTFVTYKILKLFRSGIRCLHSIAYSFTLIIRNEAESHGDQQIYTVNGV